MESYDTFKSILERAITEQNSGNLTDILKNGPKYFQNISRSEIGSVLHKLFEEDGDLLYFLNDELGRPTARKGFDGAIKEGFHFLKFIMRQFPADFHPYIILTKHTCQLALSTQCAFNIRKTACKTFNALIELFKDQDLQLVDTVETFMSLFSLLNIKERSLLFSALGTILKYNIEIVEEHNSIKIYKQLLNDFAMQCNPKVKPYPMEIEIYLDTFSDTLEHLSRHLDENNRKCLYERLLLLSNSSNHSEKKSLMRSAINLLSRHMKVFVELVYQDYRCWHDLLMNLAQEKNIYNGICAREALRSFYREIGTLMKHKNSDQDKGVFLYFKQHFEAQLRDNRQLLGLNTLRFLVYGFSQMAAPCRTYLPDNSVRDMFSLIAHRAMPLCSREDLDRAELESICDYQAALSEIATHIASLSVDQINVFTKLGILLIKRFPDIPVVSQTLAVSSLINTICAIGITDRNFLEEFLYNIIHDGVAWSCSHTLLVDAELQRELKNLQERPISYKNYLPLWSQLVKRNKYEPHVPTYVLQQLVDTMMFVCITIIEKLNLRTKLNEDNVFTDIMFSRKAENEADFRVFVNLVDLYVDLLEGLESELLANTIQKFLTNVIKVSYRYPQVSGFYKLVRACFKHLHSLDNEERKEMEVFKLLYKYIIGILDLIPTFSNELLITCLYLILDIPIVYVERVLPYTIQTFKIALIVGLSDFDLAYATLKTLERWTRHSRSQQKKDFLREIIPHLEPYLQSEESAAELSQEIIKTERKVIKRITLIDDERSLENFQNRLLLLIASLDADITMDFVHKRSMEIGSTWDKKDLLKYSLPIVDEHVDIYFDKILPRLITLAQTSGDRRTKVIACEVLYSVVAFILGKTTRNSDGLVVVYKTLCPALFHLGCDSDDVVRQLFQPLALQLAHWLSTNNMLESDVTTTFISSLFKGLCNDSNASLREFSGMCLAEFTKWCLRQDIDETRIQKNISSIIQKVINYSLHPFPCKRVAAAVAFNHLYTILREYQEIISIYWLELLCCFVKSLDGCKNPAISNAINHIERVLIAKESLLNSKCQNRRKPAEFEDATLGDAVNWLLKQCTSLNQYCRKKCMKLFITVAKYVENIDSPKALIQNYVDTRGIVAFNGMIIKNLPSKIDSLSSNVILSLLQTFDCYIWLIREQLIDVKFLFGETNPEREMIFNSASNFVRLINTVQVESKEKDVLILSKKLEDLQTLQCKVIITMFDFLQIFLNEDRNVIPEFFINADLFELISKCVMEPKSFGFDVINFEVAQELQPVLEILLQTISEKTNDALQELLKSQLRTYVEKHINDLFDLEEIMLSTSCNELKQYVRGLSILERCNLLLVLYKDKMVLRYPTKDMERIFNALSKEVMGELICVNFKPAILDYLQSLMELLLMHYQPRMTTTLIELIGNNTLLGPDSPKIQHGMYFLHLFKDAIFRYMLKNIDGTINILCSSLQGNGCLLLTIAEDLLLFVQRRKRELQQFTEDLANSMVRNFTTFERAVSNIENRKQKLINIYGIAVHLKKKPAEATDINQDFYKWILNELTTNFDMEYRVHILRNFLVCLIDMEAENRTELIAIINTLRNQMPSTSSGSISNQSVQRLKVMNCYRTLLTLLPITKSIVLYEAIISFVAGFGEGLQNEKTEEYLEKYFSCISVECSLKSIEVTYKLFVNSNRNINERFDILQIFLLPLFQFCKASETERFFERNIKEIYTIIGQSLVDDSPEISQLIVSKIGCYDLVAIMFSKVDLKNIVSLDSTITRNAIAEVKTGRELLQGLYGHALRVRTLKKTSEHGELLRLLHCSAYNCSIAIVCLKKDKDSYISIFAENRKKEQLIWENIVDCRKQYNVRQTFNEYLKQRKKLVNIRKGVKDRQRIPRRSYVYSYSLGTSTLEEDVNAYDFNRAPVRNDDTPSEGSMTLTFEVDELNNHECMASICGALKHMVLQEIFQLPTEGEVEIPKWLKCFCDSMRITLHNNVRLFMLKIILNMQTIFKSYGNYLLLSTMHAVYEYLKTNPLNYIITDILVVLIDWQIILSSEEQRVMARKLWEILIDKVLVTGSEISKGIFQYNMNLVKMTFELWQESLSVPQKLYENIRENIRGSLYVILLCLANKMESEILQRKEILEFLKRSIENWKDNEDNVLQTCECLGLILAYFERENTFVNEKDEIIALIQRVLQQMQTKFQSREIKCIKAISNNYPRAAAIYYKYVAANIHKVDLESKANCLEIFLLYLPNLTAQETKKELDYIKFHDLLKNKVSICEKVALQIMNALVSILAPSDLLPLITLVPPYAKSNSSEYRSIAYNIFMNTYKRMFTNFAKNKYAKQLISTSVEVLLSGLFDPADDLQEKVQDFWTREAQLASTCKERLLEILNVYTPNTGDAFLSFTLLMMLDLTKKSKDYEQKMSEPLVKCIYADYEISSSWRRRNLGSKTPLFAPSLAFTKTTRTLTSASLYFSKEGFSSTSEGNLRLRATEVPEFEPTMQTDEPSFSSNDTIYHGEFKVPKIPEPVYNKRSKRFLSSSFDVSEGIRQQEIKKNIHRAEAIKEEAVRQRSTVKLYRKYRIGDFPDVEITHSNLIKLLQELAKKDHLICKDLTVSIVCSLLNGERPDDFFTQVAKSLKYMIGNHRGNNSLVTAILEIFWYSRITDYSPDIIAKVSTSHGLNLLGSLVLESHLIYSDQGQCFEPPVKKSRTENTLNFSDEWLQLANLYDSMEDVDVVLSIFRNHVPEENMQEASLAQAANNWSAAKVAYERALESEKEIIKEHSFRGLLTSLSNLCRWDDIDKRIEHKLNENTDNIWCDEWKDWMFPWLLEVNVRKLLENDTPKLHVIETWLNDKEKEKYIKRFFGEELSMYFVSKESEDVRDFLRCTLGDTRESWIRLNPLSAQLRVRKLQKLRVINDIDVFLKARKQARASTDFLELLKFWNENVPLIQDDILPWDKLISYRMYFAFLVKDMINVWEKDTMQCYTESNISNDDETNVIQRLHLVSFNMHSKVMEAAIVQKNKYIAQKHLRYAEQQLADAPGDLKERFLLTGARIKYLNGEVESDIKKKMSYYVSAWKHSHKLIQEENLEPAVSVGVRQHIGSIATKIVEISKENETFAQLLMKNDLILKEINAENRDINSIIDSLEAYSLSHYKSCCDVTNSNVRECYFVLSKYCYDRVSSDPENNQLYKEFIRSTLRAMRYGSLEASRYFPCLLKPEYLEDEETRDIFTEECKEIQTWLFLSWQWQLFSHLGTSLAPLIIPILERIVETYPNAVIYTFRLTVETNPALLNNSDTYKIRQTLYDRPEVEQFLAAMKYVVQPELYLLYHLSELRKNLSKGTATAIDIFLKNFYPNTGENCSKPGRIHDTIKEYANKLKGLEKKSPDQVDKYISGIMNNVKRSLENPRRRTKLKDYSPWLQQFVGTDLEIPGQYSCDRKPMPQYHAKIMKINPTVRVMQSLRKPIQITMVGNDAKQYKFLVKFGEDLRLDQRLQQLFNIMNKTLQNDAICKQRRLSIDTYQVIPLSSVLGLIEWIDDTKSLYDLIEFTLTESQKKKHGLIYDDYYNWLKHSVSLEEEHEEYKALAVRYNAASVIEKINECINKTEWDALRRTLSLLCPSLESFVILRRNFVTSYATMCIAHWILGIGDRHLQNTLVVVGSGRCLGIDFGFAFDAAIDLIIPELVPFRLTSQICGLLKPFTENDLLGAIMTHTLRALRNEQTSILACMGVFVHEPLNWTEKVNNALQQSGEDVADVKWLPKKKINVVKEKLSGIHPSIVTLNQLKDQHSEKDLYRYQAIVTGNDDCKRTRATMKRDHLTPEEQVKCLLDQATDLNVLGRMKAGWTPWL